jgi:hypothetical protein
MLQTKLVLGPAALVALALTIDFVFAACRQQEPCALRWVPQDQGHVMMEATL